jgi:chemotaxis protein methyltransferase CheR
MDALSVPETYFWREMDQIKALVELIVPRHFAMERASPLRIWSAACATGEEPLSIALALEEAGWFGRAPIQIHASDASSAAIGRARLGAYRERSFRALPAALRAKYFREADGTWRIAPSLHARVEWSVVNLTASHEIAAMPQTQIVFCRNVFIYFSAAAIAKTVRLFAERMPSSGCLFVGVSESLLRLTTDFDLHELGGAFVYVKR